MLNKFLFLLLLVFSCKIFASTTFGEANKVFTRLQVLTGTNVTLKYDADPSSNAWTTFTEITITQGMLDDARGEADLALVLGHELGHWATGDVWTKGSRAKELRADQYGYNLCSRLGYTSCGSFMLYMYDKYGGLSDKVHPDWLTRYRHLRR